MRPQPWRNLADPPTLWIDFRGQRGVMQNGKPVIAKVGARRKSPNLQDILDTALAEGAQRVMFTGNVPAADRGQRHWLLVQTPGWNGLGHWMGKPVTGRFEHINTGRRVEIRTAAEWFGNTPLTPNKAKDAWTALKVMIDEAFEGAPIALSPAGTGTNLWAFSLPRNLDPIHLTEDIAEEIHRTSGQHHLEHLVAGPSFSKHEDCIPLVDPTKTPEADEFAYVDARFMYAALCRELGTGPGVRLNRSAANDLFEHEPYARGRLLIKYTVPDTWNHVGIFGVQHQNADDGWYYPNRPGATAVTWADTSEIHVARKFGWLIEPIEGIRFEGHAERSRKDAGHGLTTARPLDTFAKRIIRAREWVQNDDEMDPTIRAAVAAAIRAILIQTIGAFASRGRSKSIVTGSVQDLPSYAQGEAKPQGKLWVYKERQQMSERSYQFYHPEYAAQIWARGRARVLHCPTSDRKVMGGALSVDPSTLLGINGDAIYTTTLPIWSLPTADGGSDDGRVGRMRLQGYLQGSYKVPTTREARNKLRKQSSEAGALWERSYNDSEFEIADDDAIYQPAEEA
ncbi:hypothetical protein EDF61_10989 [Arthrobacter sp. JUb115]|nr:hypothetical protein EDF61_10989 [Arthrobacter sp. JUb115]